MPSRLYSAYSRGFFFGPGLPLGLGVDSPAGADLLDPGFGPGTPFRFAAEGASEFPSSVVPAGFGAGDAVGSVVLSAGTGALMVGVDTRADESSDDDDLDDAFGGDTESDGNLARSWGLSRRTTLLLCFDGFVPDLLEEGVDAMAVLVAIILMAMMVMDGGWMGRWVYC